TTVPAQSFSAPVRACVMAAARDMPGVCAVLVSSSPARTMWIPWVFQSGILEPIIAVRARNTPAQGVSRAQTAAREVPATRTSRAYRREARKAQALERRWMEGIGNQRPHSARRRFAFTTKQIACDAGKPCFD